MLGPNAQVTVAVVQPGPDHLDHLFSDMQHCQHSTSQFRPATFQGLNNRSSCGSAAWTQLTWVHCSGGSHKASIKMSAQSVVSTEAPRERPCFQAHLSCLQNLVLRNCRMEGFSLFLAMRWGGVRELPSDPRGHPQFLAPCLCCTEAAHAFQLALPKPATKDSSKTHSIILCMQSCAGNHGHVHHIRNHVHSITFAVFFWPTQRVWTS
ncbi:PREDICTED: putative uncharacterized protein encoded by LINC01555 [Mandrillus leucophaeus]|uniref:putative uncharacterized protein encoded by LINC01555 n=1 Tax=Mandrillus leucophaeus TaxID=9568 RepID=UPI0005F587E1|nr:PREDICTED: putative uncharacterized protein encoded by LINC01555 [Mandrillus leucophaeus]